MNQIQKSVSDRTTIKCAVDNIKNSTSYINQWIKRAKENPTADNITCMDYAIQLSIKVRDDFFQVEKLANLYHELWREEYYKAKHFYEKAVSEGDLIIKNNKQ